MPTYRHRHTGAIRVTRGVMGFPYVLVEDEAAVPGPQPAPDPAAEPPPAPAAPAKRGRKPKGT